SAPCTTAPCPPHPHPNPRLTSTLVRSPKFTCPSWSVSPGPEPGTTRTLTPTEPRHVPLLHDLLDPLARLALPRTTVWCFKDATSARGGKICSKTGESPALQAKPRRSCPLPPSHV